MPESLFDSLRQNAPASDSSGVGGGDGQMKACAHEWVKVPDGIFCRLCGNRGSGKATREMPFHEHDWRVDPTVVLASNPPQSRLVCAICGASKGSGIPKDWKPISRDPKDWPRA